MILSIYFIFVKKKLSFFKSNSIYIQFFIDLVFSVQFHNQFSIDNTGSGFADCSMYNNNCSTDCITISFNHEFAMGSIIICNICDECSRNSCHISRWICSSTSPLCFNFGKWQLSFDWHYFK